MSFSDDGSEGVNDIIDDFNVDHLESEDEDLQDQSEFKGKNLYSVALAARRNMNRGQKNGWMLEEEINAGKYKIVAEKKPDRTGVVRIHRETKRRLKALRDQYSTKNDI